MNKPKVIILRTAGTNCDAETAFSWEKVGADPELVHVRELMDRPNILDEYAILTIPGGFSYGDDISAGKILANQVVHHLAEALQKFVDDGKLVLGICNGFQVLLKAGLLPGRPEGGMSKQEVTLTQNDSARFEARWVHLRCPSKSNAFLPADRIIAMPVAHAEGKVVAADEPTLKRIVAHGQVSLTYCDAQGQPAGYPDNPNGSQENIAGLIDTTGQVFGLMPHPERHMCPTQHPQWTRRAADRGDGLLLFETAFKSISSN
jgi:phosphoribosylformylglycinamidine synthase